MVQSALFFVDSSALIAHMRKQKPPTILDKSVVYGIAIASEMVVFELEVGGRRAGRVLEFQTHFPALTTYPLTADILIEAAVIQAELLSKNQVIGVLDTFIAATAIHHNLPLLTLNTKHFQRIPNLRLLPLP
jgi:tRNA(fMet)-specific endonuclease VapC